MENLLKYNSVVLSSSDGTRSTIDDIEQASELIVRARERIQEINSGIYKANQSPVEFNVQTSGDLYDAYLELIRETIELGIVIGLGSANE